MAKVFVDTNYFIGLANRAPGIDTKALDNHQGYISALSCHILFYINKIKVPDKNLNSFIEDFSVVNLDDQILYQSLIGPTRDLEDNIQLHSAAKSECDIFLTLDKKLLNMKFFGRMTVQEAL